MIKQSDKHAPSLAASAKGLALAAMLALVIPMTAQSDAYSAGQAALKRAEWLAAVEAFEQAAKEDAKQADAALYWQAYALMQAGRDRQAQRRIRELERSFPESRWLNDARALTVSGENLQQDQEPMDESMRLYALSRLMERDPERALPLVLDLVRKTDSDRTRRDALFVLGMSDNAQSRAAIGQIARSADDPALQIQAIHALGAADDDQAIALMRELFRETDDQGVQQAIVHAAIAADAEDLLLDIVRSVNNASVQNAAIQALGAIDATGALRALYPDITDRGSRIAVLHAMAIADDTAALAEVIRQESDPDLRAMAIRNLGMTGDAQAAEMLQEIYKDAGREDRLAVIEALVMLDEAGHHLALHIARTETDPALQARAIQVLGVADAIDALRELYRHVGPEQRKAIMQSLAIADDAEGLLDILRTESDSAVRLNAIQSLAIVDDEQQVGEVLLELYPNAESGERDAILNALMIREDAKTMIALMQAEAEPDRKRRILQLLTMIDDDAANDYLFEMVEKPD